MNINALFFDYTTDYEKVVHTVHHEFRSIKSRFQGLFQISVPIDSMFYEDWILLFEKWENDAVYLNTQYVDSQKYRHGHAYIMAEIQKVLLRNTVILEQLYHFTFPNSNFDNEFFIYWIITRMEAHKLVDSLNDFNYYKKT